MNFHKSRVVILCVLLYLFLSPIFHVAGIIGKDQRNEKEFPVIVIKKLKIIGGSGPIRSDSDIREEILYPKTAKLTWKDDFIRIEFELESNTASKNSQFAYKILGYQEDWIHIGNKKYIMLENLKAGNYEIQITGSNIEGVWSEVPASLKLELVPAFWKTSLFKGIIILVFVTIFSCAYCFFKKKYKTLAVGNINYSQIVGKYNLTKREIEILQLLLNGLGIADISQKLYISQSTVQKHIYSVYKKFNIKNRIQLFNVARRFSQK